MDGELPVINRFFINLVPGFETSLKLPPPFVKTLSNVDLNTKQAVLNSCQGCWRVGVMNCSDGLLHFSGENWEAYVKDHGLIVGDSIVFEQMGTGRLRFNTLVFDESCCEKNFDALMEDVNGGEEVPPGGSEQNVNSQFQMTVSKSNLKRGYMGIPKAFATSNGLSQQGPVTLRNATGESWQAKLNVCNESGANGAFHNRFQCVGLCGFFKENKLKIGDTCIFELDHSSGNPKHVVMNVTFVSSNDNTDFTTPSKTTTTTTTTTAGAVIEDENEAQITPQITPSTIPLPSTPFNADLLVPMQKAMIPATPAVLPVEEIEYSFEEGRLALMHAKRPRLCV